MFSNQDLNLRNKLQNATFGAQFFVVLKIAQLEKKTRITLKFLNVVLEKDGDDQLDRSCEK